MQVLLLFLFFSTKGGGGGEKEEKRTRGERKGEGEKKKPALSADLGGYCRPGSLRISGSLNWPILALGGTVYVGDERRGEIGREIRAEKGWKADRVKASRGWTRRKRLGMIFLFLFFMEWKEIESRGRIKDLVSTSWRLTISIEKQGSKRFRFSSQKEGRAQVFEKKRRKRKRKRKKKKEKRKKKKKKKKKNNLSCFVFGWEEKGEKEVKGGKKENIPTWQKGTKILSSPLPFSFLFLSFLFLFLFFISDCKTACLLPVHFFQPSLVVSKVLQLKLSELVLPELVQKLLKKLGDLVQLLFHPILFNRKSQGSVDWEPVYVSLLQLAVDIIYSKDSETARKNKANNCANLPEL